MKKYSAGVGGEWRIRATDGGVETGQHASSFIKLIINIRLTMAQLAVRFNML